MAEIGMPWSRPGARTNAPNYEYNNSNQYITDVPEYHSYFFGRFLIHRNGPKAAIWAGNILQISLAFFCISLALLIFVYASDFENLFGPSAEGRTTETTPINGTTTTTQRTIHLAAPRDNKYELSNSSSAQFFYWTRLITPPVCGVSGFICIVCGIILYCYKGHVVRGIERFQHSPNGQAWELSAEGRQHQNDAMKQINTIDTAGESYDYQGPHTSPEIIMAAQLQPPVQGSLSYQPPPTNQHLPSTYNNQPASAPLPAGNHAQIKDLYY